MHRFFVPEIMEAVEHYILPEEESKHACRVLRLKIGDKIALINGRGSLFNCEITEDHPKHCIVKIVSTYTETADSPHIHIAISPTKNMDRLEWFLEKATEIGVHEVTPIIGDNSERKIIKSERLEKILISATKQSKRLYIPKLNPIVTVKEFIEKTPFAYIAHCEDDNTKVELTSNEMNDSFTILIGPEGDFSLQEIKLALKKGFKPVMLGKNRLRTETAGIYAVTLAKILQQ